MANNWTNTSNTQTKSQRRSDTKSINHSQTSKTQTSNANTAKAQTDLSDDWHNTSDYSDWNVRLDALSVGNSGNKGCNKSGRSDGDKGKEDNGLELINFSSLYLTRKVLEIFMSSRLYCLTYELVHGDGLVFGRLL